MANKCFRSTLGSSKSDGVDFEDINFHDNETLTSVNNLLSNNDLNYNNICSKMDCESSFFQNGREIFDACKNGDLEAVKTLITKNNVNVKDTAGRKSSPLHFAAGFGRKDIVEFLISLGANVEAKDDGGLVPLHNACSFGHAEVVKTLLEHGSNVNAKDNWHYTPLHEAAIKGKVDVCIILLQKGAELSIKNSDDKTPVDLSDSIAKLVLTGEYKKEELLDCARNGKIDKMMMLLTPLNVNCHASDGRRSTPLHLAAGYNRVNIVQLLLDNGADVHAKDKGGLVPLHNACSYGHFEITELLIKYGADCNVMDLWQFTPLHEAASKNRCDVCTLLLAHGADCTQLNCHSKSPVDLAASSELAERIIYEHKGFQLLESCRLCDVSGVKKMCQDDLIHFKHPFTHDSPIHSVIQSISSGRRKQCIELLIKKGVSIETKNKDLLTPLHMATDKCLVDLMDLLLKNGAKVNTLDGQGQTALHRAAVTGNAQSLRLLLQYGCDKSILSLLGFTAQQMAPESLQKIFTENQRHSMTAINTQLLEAAKIGELEVVKRIVQAYPKSVNCRDVDGRHSTPLHFAAGYNRKSVVEFLLKNGADVHAKDKGGLVPLHNACSYGHYEVTQMLIEHKANVNIWDLWKYTPLHEASAKGKFDICKLLLKHGADKTRKNRDGYSPLDLVKQGDSDVEDLLRGDVALLEAAKKGDLAKVQKLLTPENINCKDTQGRNSTPLHLAAGYNNLEVVAHLLEMGADVNVQDKGGLIPLHNASSYGHVDIASVLIKYNTCVNAVDKWGFTALHEAAQKGRTQLCALLLAHGADPMLKNQDNQTPYDLATAEDVKSILQAVMPSLCEEPIIIVPSEAPPSSSKNTLSNNTRPQVDGKALQPPNNPLTPTPNTITPSTTTFSILDNISNANGDFHAVTTTPNDTVDVDMLEINNNIDTDDFLLVDDNFVTNGTVNNTPTLPQSSQSPILQTPIEHTTNQSIDRQLSVEQFLTELNLSCLAEILQREQICMDVLIEMNHEDLKNAGVLAFGHRHKIIKKIEKLYGE